MWFKALALLLMFEGLMPFVAPTAWRRVMKQLSEWPDAQLRLMGLGMVAAGLLLSWLGD